MKKIIRVSTVADSLNELLRGQLRMLSKKYNIVGVASPGKHLKELGEREGIKVIAVPMERRIALFRDVMSLWHLFRVFRKEKPDMVHSITPKAGLLSMLAAKLAGVPVRMHTFTGLVFPASTGWKQYLLICMDRLTSACATHINPEGEGVKRDLIRYNITKKELNVWANGNVNGIDIEYFSRTPSVEAEAQKYRDNNVFTYIFVGRLVKDKGINELVAAFCQLYKEDHRIRLLLVGGFEKHLDPVLPEIETEIYNHPGILFVGFQHDVRPYFACADVFILPSYREGFPNVVLQAGAMGVASVVTDINGSNEIVIPNVNGLIIPSRDKNALYKVMKYCKENVEFVKDMGRRSRPLVVRKFKQQIVWDAILQNYEKILK